MGWQAATSYGKRALVEAAFHRYKVLIGRSPTHSLISTSKSSTFRHGAFGSGASRARSSSRHASCQPTALRS